MQLNKPHINELIQLCLLQDQQAQLEVYERYYKAMYNTAYRILKNSAEAEDVMQDSFLSAFTKLDSFKGEVAFGAWLKRIVINNSLYCLKQQQKNEKVSLDAVLYKDEDSDENIENTDINELKIRKVLASLNALKDNYRISLTLHLIEGYDYEEIAEIMQISYANCRTVISRAKQSLRDKLLIK